MSALIGETIVCGQHTGDDVQLKIIGDEFYARYETLDGYTVLYDKNYGGYCYALLAAGRFVSSGIPIGKPQPAGMSKHLKEVPNVRNEKFGRSYERTRPREDNPDTSATRTLGPDGGLLSGRKLHKGTIKGLTVIVDFDDVKTGISRDAVDEMFNGVQYHVNGNACSVNEYFKIVSSGKLDYVNTVVGPVTLSGRRSQYISNLLVREALDLAVANFGINLSDYDSRNEGIVDAINFLYAGNSQYNGALWPHNSVMQLHYGNVRTHYYQLTGLGDRMIDLRIGTVCHENGHMLCRFPDLYDYGREDGDSEKSQGMGRYCLMSSGNHLNDRRAPSPVCAYLRELAGWIDCIVPLTLLQRISARHGTYDTAWKYETALPNEYFLIENRHRMGLDSHLLSSGLAVYHCDTLGSNEWQEGTRNRHYQCALLQADGSLDLENNRNVGDEGDMFGETQGVAISDTTIPSSRMWDGTDSGLMVSEIGAPSQDIAFTVGQPQQHPVVEAEAFPNLIIPDNDPNGVTTGLSVDSYGEITDISVDVEIIHSWISDLRVSVLAPDGTEVVLHDREGADGDDIRKTYGSDTFANLANLRGREVYGDWSLLVIDKASQDVGRLVRWGLTIQYRRHATTVTATADPRAVIPDYDNQGVSSEIQIQVIGTVRNITIDVDIEHTYIGDLQVDLVSSTGHTVRLHNNTGGYNRDIKRSYDIISTPDLNALIGESIQGSWWLIVRDLAPRDEGALVSWSVTVEY